MFGRILTINKNQALVEIGEQASLAKDLINLHVVFEDKEKRILGEIESIEKTTVKVNFLGEISDTDFIGGLVRKPSLESSIRVINEKELSVITGEIERGINLGVSPLYNNYPLNVSIDELFSNHNAIFGNTGSGKTYGICRIIQNIFPSNNIIPYKANLFIFDSFGEYINAFKDLSKNNPYYQFKVISTSSNMEGKEKLNIPVHLLKLDDVLNLLEASEFSQIAMVETALTYAKAFARKDQEAIDFKNHVLAKAITSIMYTNQTSSRIRDQIFEILSETNTEELKLDAIIPGIGFTRQFRNCFDIDSEGRFAERKIVSDYIQGLIDENRKWDLSDRNIPYGLKDLEVALSFTLYSERYLLNEKVYNDAISLKVKLHDLALRQYSEFFTGDKYWTNEEYIQYLQNINGMKAQIVNVNLEDTDDRFARTVVKFLSRFFLAYTRSLRQRASFPIHLILEEAHRYVIDGDDKKLLGYNVFERIAKEGRKYGILLNLITQRPVDINENVISQCANFIIFKINHPLDLEYITKMIPNMSEDIVDKQKSLQSGTCVAFGRLFKIPMICKMEKADPPPSSSNCEIYNNWMVKLKDNTSDNTTV